MFEGRNINEQVLKIIEETEDNKYTVRQIGDIIITNNHDIAEENGEVPERIKVGYYAVVRTALQNLVKEGKLSLDKEDEDKFHKI
ncbi:hypothetical protein U8V72_17475 [Priestia filamentosa]|uniref:hypothetical protein n=1 Tax=Priestia filamentosa TaxID=1402861 RepID=UPI000589343D